MAENEIQIEKLDSGKYIAVLQYGATKVSCANGTSPTLTDYARNAIRLIKQAVDLGWFPNTTQIRVMGTPHDTSGGKPDFKHITMSVVPASKHAKHLYILPNNSEGTILDSDTLDTSKPPQLV